MTRTMKIVLPFCVMAATMLAAPFISSPAYAEENWAGMDQVNIGLLSIGARATYWDQKDGEDRWFGGAQLRLHPSHYFALEGSADYRREKFNSGTGETKTHTYPVQVSALIYPLGTTRLAPFLLAGGGWYYTSVEGPGNFSDTQNRFGFHAGGGLQFFFSQSFSVDSTYRYIWLEDVKSKDQNVIDKNFNANGHMVTIGLNLHF